MNSIEIILKTLIKMHKLTQIELSKKTDIPLPTIRKYLKSEFNPSEKNLEKIENTFKIDILNLMNKNLNDMTIVKNLINTLEKLLYELITKIDKVEKEKTLNEYEKLEQYKNTRTIFKNTIILLTEIENNLNFEIYRKKESLVIFTLDNYILNILRKYNVLITVIDENTYKIDFDNKTYNIDISLLSDITELLKNNLVNDFKFMIELIDKK
jgi:possible transcriptional regulator